MTLDEFKEKRNVIIDKLAYLIVEISDQGKYNPRIEFWMSDTLYINIKSNEEKPKQIFNFKYVCLGDNTWMPMEHKGEINQYELILKDLNECYEKMSEFLDREFFERKITRLISLKHDLDNIGAINNESQI